MLCSPFKRTEYRFEEKISQLYNNSKKKHHLDIMAEVLETRKILVKQWKKLRRTKKALTEQITTSTHFPVILQHNDSDDL